MTDEIKSIQDKISQLEARLSKLDAERNSITRHILEQKDRLSILEQAKLNTPSKQNTIPSCRSVSMTSKQKVALFMDLFRGRTDVYPKLWINNKKNTKGYSPACSNEWIHGLCKKPKIKCRECTNQAFMPVTKKTIYDHLQGHHIVGVYPMLQDETCWFLAVDFDKGQWRDDVTAFVKTCLTKNIPYAVERSRSGNGAHVWFFFASPVPASTARKMGCFLITETMIDRHELPMTSYDRFFPNQDTMPRGGLGNLIALPFQDAPRRQGNSIFVDEAWTPFDDQWRFLASLRRMQPEEVEVIANEAVKKGQVLDLKMVESDDDEMADKPWLRTPSCRRSNEAIPGPLPSQASAVLSQQLFVDKEGLPSALINQIKRLAAFQNPEFYKKQAMRLPTALISRVISCAVDHPRHTGLPRGCTEDLKKMLLKLGIKLSVDDQRTSGHALEIDFHAELTSKQNEVVKVMREHEIGVFVAPPGSGKTVVGINLISQRKRNALVLVHRTQLLEQWISQLSLFLDLKPTKIGQIGGGKRKPTGNLDVAMIQSLAKKDVVDDIVATYGHVIVDECHHVPAVSFERIMREVKARYIVGLTATPRRRDGHEPISQQQLGPIRFTIDAKSQAADRSFDHKLIVRDTDFCFSDDKTNSSHFNIQEIYNQLVQDENRNQLILNDVIQALEKKRSPILLTERREHLEYFAKHLKGLTRNLIILQGGMKPKERRIAMDRLTTIPETEERLVMATGKFIGEGFDDARLDTLFLTLPISWKGTLQQYAGRLHRKHHAKSEVIMMDYVDRNVPALARMFANRMKGYKAMGYSVSEYVMMEHDEDEYVIEYDENYIRDFDMDF